MPGRQNPRRRSRRSVLAAMPALPLTGAVSACSGGADVRVALRMLGPGLVTVFLFQLTAIWNHLFLPMVMLSDQDLYPVSLGLYQGNSSASVSPEYYPVVITGSLLAVIPLILLLAFALLQRFWRSGLTAGSVK